MGAPPSVLHVFEPPSVLHVFEPPSVPFEDEEDEVVGDPFGAIRVFSIEPTTARYPLKDRTAALCLRSWYFSFYGCLTIFDDGGMVRLEETYAVPSGWETRFPHPKFTRIEIWRITL
jgi:hypothetical protein